MIVKFIPNRGSGSCRATMDYLLGKDRDRENARLLVGNPDLTERLADNSDFKNRYTVGVLSFEEPNIPEQDKQAIMADFEKSLLAGLECDQYNICWIEHTDKGRLELNFVIPNMELMTGKRLQPYYDKADRPLVENWKQVTNFNYGLSDPHDPSRAEAVKIDRHRLPKSVQDIKQQIGAVIAQQIAQGEITDRQGVIDTLQQAGFEIARQTEKSISIKNPEGGRNIRLEGVIYENRNFATEFAEERERAKQEYASTARERYQTALNKLQRAVTVKQTANRATFKRPADPYQTQHREPNISHHEKNATGRDNGLSPSTLGGTVGDKSLHGQQYSGQTSGISGHSETNRPDTHSSSSTGESDNHPKQRQEPLDNRQEPQEIGSGQGHQRQSVDKTRVKDNAKQRLFERLQRLTERFRTAVERLADQKSLSERANQAIIDSQSDLTATSPDLQQRADRAIAVTNQSIREREQATSDHLRNAEQYNQEKQAQMKNSPDRGIAW